MPVQMGRRTSPGSWRRYTGTTGSYVLDHPPPSGLQLTLRSSSLEQGSWVLGEPGIIRQGLIHTVLMRSTAYVHGLNFCTGTFVIIMDADFSHHVSCLYSMGRIAYASPSSSRS